MLSLKYLNWIGVPCLALWFSCNFDDQFSLNFHRFVMLCICLYTPSEKAGLWQLPKVFSIFKDNLKINRTTTRTVSTMSCTKHVQYPWLWLMKTKNQFKTDLLLTYTVIVYFLHPRYHKINSSYGIGIVMMVNLLIKFKDSGYYW